MQLISNPGGSACLYQVVAHGMQFAPTCERGHELVLELLERFDVLVDRAPARLAPVPAHLPVLEGWSYPGGLTGFTSSAHAASRVIGTPVLTLDAIWTAPQSSPPTPPVPVVAQGQPTGSGPPGNTLPAAHQPTLLSELATEHLTDMIRSQRDPNSSAVRERRYVLKFLEDLIGDKPLDAVSVNDANTIADALAVWPAYLHNRADYRDIAPDRVVAKARREKPEPIMKSTQAKHILGLKAFFHWAMEGGAVAQDPFRFIKLTRYRDLVPKKKKPFSAQDLRALFHPDRQRRWRQPHKFWVPLIAMYSGMRVTEICQLYLADLKVEETVDDQDQPLTIRYFDVTPFREGQSVKTKYSCRRVPIHSKLIELGLLRYVEDVRATGATRLFPGLTWSSGGPGQALTRWFNRDHLRQSCGIVDRDKTLHCFRHTLTTLADRTKIAPSVIRTLNGHSDGQGIEEKSYVARASLWECQQALEKLPFPELDDVPYDGERFAAYLAGATRANSPDGPAHATSKTRPTRRAKTMAALE